MVLGLSLQSRACFDQEGTCQKLTIGDYSLVSQKKIFGTIYEYTYRAKVTNPGPLLAKSVTARAKSLAWNVNVVEGLIAFGDVPPGQTVTSSDTFTVKVDTRFPLKDWNIFWIVRANYPPIAEAGSKQNLYPVIRPTKLTSPT